MTQNIPFISRWFVTGNYRAKAKIKYEIRHLESHLNAFVNDKNSHDLGFEEIHSLSGILAQRYLDYLKLTDEKNTVNLSDFSVSDIPINWLEHHNQILYLKSQLAKTINHEGTNTLIAEIVLHYYQITQSIKSINKPAGVKLVNNELLSEQKQDNFKQLFQEYNLHSWLHLLVRIWNQNEFTHLEPSLLFRNWSIQRQQAALDFFAEETFVDLVNSIFFTNCIPINYITSFYIRKN